MSEVRYERKFATTELSKRELQALVRSHPAHFSELYPQRWVNNIYFDTLDFRAVQETLDGVSRRRKMRIRWYGDFMSELPKPQLERKTKEGFIVGKTAWPLAPLAVGPSLGSRDVAASIRGAELPERLRLAMSPLRPVLFNRYSRRYYLSGDKKFRLTIDEALQYHAFRPLGGCLLQWAHQRQVLVLELKYELEHDDQARDLAQDLPLRVSRNSKYVSGMSLVYPSVEL